MILGSVFFFLSFSLFPLTPSDLACGLFWSRAVLCYAVMANKRAQWSVLSLHLVVSALVPPKLGFSSELPTGTTTAYAFAIARLSAQRNSSSISNCANCSPRRSCSLSPSATKPCPPEKAPCRVHLPARSNWPSVDVLVPLL